MQLSDQIWVTGLEDLGNTGNSDNTLIGVVQGQEVLRIDASLPRLVFAGYMGKWIRYRPSGGGKLRKCAVLILTFEFQTPSLTAAHAL